MRAAVASLVGLCLLAGLISADQYAWKNGKTYRYNARGRLLAGISEINTQYSGLDLSYSLEIAVIGPNKIHLHPQEFQVTEVNDEQDGGWRDVPELKGETPVEIPQKYLDYLQSPVEVKLDRNGAVESIRVQGDLPTWAINIKKAQVSAIMTLDSAAARAIMTGNVNRPDNQVRPEDPSTRAGDYYETMEETVLGECQTYYTHSESSFSSPRTDALKNELQQDDEQQDSNESQDQRAKKQSRQTDSQESDEESSEEKHSKYMAYRDMIKDNSASGSSEEYGVLAPETFHRLCEGSRKLMEFTKSVNYSMCKTKPVLGYASPSFILSSRAGDNTFGAALGRVSFTRYITCGKDRKQLTILKVDQEEQAYQGILRKEKVISGAVQNITLESILPTSRVPVPPRNPKEIKELTYTFDPREQKMRREGKLQTAFEADQESSNDKDNQSQSSQQSSEETQYQPSASRSARRPRATQEQAYYEQEQESNNQMYQADKLQWFSDSEGKSQLPKPSLVQPPLNPMLASPLDTEGMKKRVDELLDEIVQDLTDEKSIADAETLSKIASVAKVLRFLNYVAVEELYHSQAAKDQTVADQIQRSIFLDAVAMAGTNPNIKLLIDLIAKQEIKGEEAAQLIMTFAQHIRTPTAELITYFHEKLVHFSPRPEDMDQVRSTAILAFSNLIYDACVNTRIANSRYPVQIYGKFCQMNPANFVNHFTQNLKQALEEMKRDEHSLGASHWATIYLTALGNTGHPLVVKEVQKVLDTETDSYIKTKAVFALKRLIVSRSSQIIPASEFQSVDRRSSDLLTDAFIEKNVLPVLAGVAFDKTEHHSTRMAAVALLVRATPTDATLWQQLAYSTWFELNQEVHSYIYHTIRNFALLSPRGSVHWQAQRHASSVLPLVKPIDLGLAASRVWMESDFMEELQSGYGHQFSMFGSESSVIPNAFHYSSYQNAGNGAMGVSPLSISGHGHDLHNLFHHLIGKFVRRISPSVVEGNDAIKQIAEILNIVERDQDETPQASLKIKLYDEMERVFSVNKEVIDRWIEHLKTTHIPQLLAGYPFNWQKAVKLSGATFEYPSIFGIPITTVTRSHNLASVRGSVKAIVSLRPRDVQVNAEFHAINSYKTHSTVTIKSPFTGKAYRAGVAYHAVVELPARVSVWKTAAGALHIAVTPTHIKEGAVAGSIDIATFHRRPYTMIVTDELYPSSHRSGGQMKIVRAIEKPYKHEVEFGEKSLGLSFKLEHESDFRPENENFAGWARYMKRFTRTAGSYVHTGLMGAKTLRFAQRKLTLDVSQSKTKTLELILIAKYRRTAPHYVTAASEENKLQASAENSPSSSSDEDSQDTKETDVKQHTAQEYYRKQYNKYQEQKKQYEQDDSSSEESKENYEGEFEYYPSEYYKQANSYEEEYQYQSAQPDAIGKRWFVAVLVGKSLVLREPLKLKEMQSQYLKAPSTVHYMISGVASAPSQVYIRVSAGQPTKEHARELQQNSAAIDEIKKIMIDSQLTNSQTPFCGDYEGNYEFPKHANRDDILVLREPLLREQELKVKVRGEISFGTSCRQQRHNVTFKGELSRDQDLYNWAKFESDEAKQCSEDEKKGFNSSPVCIENAEQQAAALNYAKFQINSTPLPAAVLNATLQVKEFIKAYLYEYMSYDPMPIRPLVLDDTLRAEVQLDPEFEFMTIKYMSQRESIFFEDIKLKGIAKALTPVTATQTIRENIRDRVFKTQASCSVGGKYVNTLDNVTYSFEQSAATNCHHVVLQDCANEKSISVLATNLGSKTLKTTVLLPGNFRVELNPVLRQKQNYQAYRTAVDNKKVWPGQGRVMVNGKPIERLPFILNDKHGHFIARIEQTSSAGLELYANEVALTTDGDHLVVYPSQELRNQSCGMCANFDGSKTIDLKSPRDCPLSSGTLMMASYALQAPWDKNSGECKVSEEIKKQIQREERDCIQAEQIPSLQAGDCKQTLIDKLKDTVYSVVKKTLKYIPFVNSEKWASKARDAVASMLQGHVKADDIAAIVAKGISKLIPYAGGILEPAIRAALKPIVKIICDQSGCCDTYYYF